MGPQIQVFCIYKGDMCFIIVQICKKFQQIDDFAGDRPERVVCVVSSREIIHTDVNRNKIMCSGQYGNLVFEIWT